MKTQSKSYQDAAFVAHVAANYGLMLEALKVAAQTMERLNRDFGMEVAAHARTAIPKGWDIFDFHRIIRQAEGK